MKSYFFAKIISYEDEQDKYYLDTVCGFAEDYAEAAESIENYYRSSLIKIKELELLEPVSSEIFIVPDSVRQKYHDEDWFAYSKVCDEEGNVING